MGNRSKDLVIGTVAVVAAGLSLYFGFGGRSQKINLTTYDVLGTVTGEETAQLAADQGVVLVVVRDTGPDKNPSLEAELSALQGALKKHPRIHLRIERVQLPPMSMMATGGALPADQLLKAMQRNPDAQALILFSPFPRLNDSELETVKQAHLKTVVVSSLRPEYASLLDQQVIHLAIVPRPENPAPGAIAPRSVRERFDQEFVLVKGPQASR